MSPLTINPELVTPTEPEFSKGPSGDPLIEMYPNLKDKINESRKIGASDEEIRGKIGDLIKKSRDAGFSIRDINKHLGIEQPKAPGKRFALAFTEGALSSTTADLRRVAEKAIDAEEITEQAEGRFIPQSFAEESFLSAGSLILDLPLFVLGGMIAGTPGAFGGHALVEEVSHQILSDEELKPEERASRVAEATTKGAILGTLMKGSQLFKGPVKQLVAEVGTLAVAGPALEGERPTLNGTLQAALFVGGFRGMNASVRFGANLMKKSTKQVRKDIDERAAKDDIDIEEAAYKVLTENIDDKARDIISDEGRINANKVETTEEVKLRIDESNKAEKEVAKKTEEIKVDEEGKESKVELEKEIPDEKEIGGEVLTKDKLEEAAPDILVEALKKKKPVVEEVIEEIKEPTTREEIIEARKEKKDRRKAEREEAKPVDIVKMRDFQFKEGDIVETPSGRMEILFEDVTIEGESAYRVAPIDGGQWTIVKEVDAKLVPKQQIAKTTETTIRKAEKELDKTVEDTELAKLIKEQRDDNIDIDSELRRKIAKEYGEDWVEDFDIGVDAFKSEGMSKKDAEVAAFEEIKVEADPKVIAREEKIKPSVKTQKEETARLIKQDAKLKAKQEFEVERVEQNRKDAEELLTDDLRDVIAKASREPSSLTPEDFDLLRPIGGLKRGIELVRAERGIIDESITMDKIDVDSLEIPIRDKDTKLYSGLPMDEMLDFLTKGAKSAVRKSRVASSDIWVSTKEWTRSPEYHPIIRNLVYALHDRIERFPRSAVFVAKELSEPYQKLSKASKEKVGVYRERGDREGKVYSREEMRNLTEEEFAGYKAVRSTIDYMHGTVLRGQVSEFYKRTLTKDQISKYKDKEEAVTKLTDKFIKDTYIEGYEPRYRFGRYIAHVTRDKDGKTIHNEGVATREEAEAIVARFDGRGKDSGVIDTKRTPHESRELLAISNYMPAIERMLTKAGVKDVDSTEVINLVRQQTAMGRLAKRKGIAGYSRDLDKSLDTYINHFPTAMAKRFNADVFSEIIRKFPKEHKQYSKDLVDYFYGRKWTEGSVNRALRSAIYMNYLAIKPAFGILNFTQRFTMTQPWLVHQIREMSKVEGARKGGVEATAEGWKMLAEAQYKEMRLQTDLVLNYKWGGGNFLDVVVKANYLTKTNKHILRRLYRQGELKELRQLELTGGNRALKYLDIFGFLSERSNRVHAAITSADLYKKSGMELNQIERMSDRFVNRSQILYSKANRPKFARGKLAPIMMFKSYVVGYMNMAHTLYGKDKAGFANMMANMIALGGLSSLPFWENELQPIIDEGMERYYGRDWHILKRKVAAKINSNKAISMLVNGAPSALGIDTSSMLSVSGFVGTPVTDMFRGGVNLKDNLTRSDIPASRKWRMIAPSQIKKFITFRELVKYGTTLDKFGKPYVTKKDMMDLPLEVQRDAMEIYNNLPKEWSYVQKLEVLLGFPSMQLNTYYKDVMAIRETTMSLNKTKAELNRAYSRAMFEEDKETMAKIEKKAKKEKVNLDIDSIVGHLFEYQELSK